MITLDVNIIVYSAFIGVIYAVLGYMKNRGKEDFDAVKFARTVLVGAVVGVVAPYVGISLEGFDFENAATAAGMIYILQTLVQALVRK